MIINQVKRATHLSTSKYGDLFLIYRQHPR